MRRDVIFLNGRIWRNKGLSVTQTSSNAEPKLIANSPLQTPKRPKQSASSTVNSAKKPKSPARSTSQTAKRPKHPTHTTFRSKKILKRRTSSLRTGNIPKHPASSTKRTANYIYRDPLYGFALKLPVSWRRYTTVERSRRLEDAEYGVFFRFKYKGKVYDDVLSVLVYKMTLQQWHDEGYDESPIQLLAARGGRIFAYTVPGELPEEFLSKAGDDYDYKKFGREIALLKRMVNDEVPQIVKTFKLKSVSTR